LKGKTAFGLLALVGLLAGVLIARAGFAVTQISGRHADQQCGNSERGKNVKDGRLLEID